MRARTSKHRNRNGTPNTHNIPASLERVRAMVPRLHVQPASQRSVTVTVKKTGHPPFPRPFPGEADSPASRDRCDAMLRVSPAQRMLAWLSRWTVGRQ